MMMKELSAVVDMLGNNSRRKALGHKWLFIVRKCIRKLQKPLTVLDKLTVRIWRSLNSMEQLHVLYVI